jgi:hypothetical protein
MHACDLGTSARPEPGRRAAGDGIWIRCPSIGIERGAKIIQLFGWDRSAEQGVAVSMESLAVNHNSLNPP